MFLNARDTQKDIKVNLKKNNNIIIFYNTLFAKYYKENLKLTDSEFEIGKTNLKIQGVPVSLKLPIEIFSEIVNKHIKKRTSNE